jgi:hypothetical protein
MGRTARMHERTLRRVQGSDNTASDNPCAIWQHLLCIVVPYITAQLALPAWSSVCSSVHAGSMHGQWQQQQHPT